MIWRIVRSRGFIPMVLILGALLYWKLHSDSPKVISVGYVGDRDVILWNTLAQVRESVGELHYGDRVEVVRVEGPATQVRTASGTIGWMRDSRQIMDSELWAKSASLYEKARTLPVQARGRTKTVSNLRVEPGRDAKRIFQFGRGTPVLILERAVSDASPGSEETAQEEKPASDTDQEKSKREDWLLVLRSIDPPVNSDGGPSPGDGPAVVKAATSDAVSSGPAVAQLVPAAMGGPAGPIAGWVLARFIELDLPDAVKDYASSADLHVVAWFELNRVPDGSGGDVPQYLVAGSHGGEGSACDFTMLRVYTWSTVRKRYETAYVESDLCGRLPIRTSSGAKGPEFKFPDVDEGGADRSYVMIQTSVRRVKEAASHSPHSRN
ncbi:MAG TPA: hypothetical protein VGP19_00565 [Candidatus Acidoferrales bacterium]|jgi:hypothetical protein|nr:hypothetical protein [Candidatus Acidoferrales bacterium]